MPKIIDSGETCTYYVVVGDRENGKVNARRASLRCVELLLLAAAAADSGSGSGSCGMLRTKTTTKAHYYIISVALLRGKVINRKSTGTRAVFKQILML